MIKYDLEFKLGKYLIPVHTQMIIYPPIPNEILIFF